MSISRRAMLTSAFGVATAGAAGLNVLAAQEPVASDDFVTRHITRELKRHYRRVAKNRKISTSTASVLSTYLRLMADHPSMTVLQAELAGKHKDELLFATDYEKHARQMKKQFGLTVPLETLVNAQPEFTEKDRLVSAMQSDLSDLLRGFAAAIEDQAEQDSIPLHRLTAGRLNENFKIVTVQNDEDIRMRRRAYICDWFRSIGYGLQFMGIVASMSGAGVVAGGVIGLTGLFFSAESGYICSMQV